VKARTVQGTGDKIMKATEKNFINFIKKRREEGLLYAVGTYSILNKIKTKVPESERELEDQEVTDQIKAKYSSII